MQVWFGVLFSVLSLIVVNYSEKSKKASYAEAMMKHLIEPQDQDSQLDIVKEGGDEDSEDLVDHEEVKDEV